MNKLSLQTSTVQAYLVFSLPIALLNLIGLIVLHGQFGLSIIPASIAASEGAVLTAYMLQRVVATERPSRHFQTLAITQVIVLLTPIVTTASLSIVPPAGQIAYPLINLVALMVASLVSYVILLWQSETGVLVAGGSIQHWQEAPAKHTPPPSSWKARQQDIKRAIILAASVGALVFTVGIIATTQMGAWATFATCCIALILFVRPTINLRTSFTYLLATAVGVSAVDYFSWRVGVINWGNWVIALPLVAAEIFGILHTLGFQFTVWPRPEAPLNTDEDPTLRPIFVFIPTVNEGVAILRETLDGILAARARYLEHYPHGQVNIVICNDGRVAKSADWEDVETLAATMGAICVTRTVKGGAKAGNIENARQQVGGIGDALLVIFDADQVAHPDFLMKTIPPFRDKTIGWVQTGQYYTNLENPVARWAQDQQALFYEILCPGKSTQNAAFICGTNVVLRAAALDQIGGLPQDSITEDFAASIELHKTWRSIYLTGVLATGLGPMELKSYFKQQGRWAMGTLGICRTHWKHIFLPERHGLTISQRIQYALACTHYVCGLRDLIYLVSPIIFLVTGIPAVRGATLVAFLWHFLPYFIASQVMFWHAGRGKTGLRGILLGFSCFPVLVNSLITVVKGKRVGFAITAKKRTADQPWWRAVLAHLLFLIACGVGLLLVLRPHSEDDQLKTMVSAFWVLYNGALLAGALWLALADRYSENWLKLAWPRPATAFATMGRLKLAMPLFIIVMFAGMLILPVMLHSAKATTVTHADLVQEAQARYFGVSVPYDMVGTRVATLEQQMNFHFALVGRTQEISDTFDEAWATQLASHGQRPWITLLFTVPGEPAYNASLPAIANGFHDAALHKWAHSISQFAKPLYITILQHVDRNWATSSAVTNFGVPQDVPRAWMHTRQIFLEEGATNVTWVWAPADPVHDDAYMPPKSSIDAILISMISYPDTQWVDPQTTLDALTSHHPGLPLMVEVSASGEPAKKAAWLNRVSDAMAHNPNIHALVYHEGAPGANPTAADRLAWSMLSDPLTTKWLQDLNRTHAVAFAPAGSISSTHDKSDF